MKEYIEELIEKTSDKLAERLADHIINSGLLSPTISPSEERPRPYPYPLDGVAVMYGVQLDKTTYRYDPNVVNSTSTIEMKEEKQ